MGILINYSNLNNGISIEGVYSKIIRFEYSEIPHKHINITVALFSSKKARDEDKEAFEIVSYEVDLRDKKNEDLFGDDVMDKQDFNYKKASYSYLKRLDKYKNGKDE